MDDRRGSRELPVMDGRIRVPYSRSAGMRVRAVFADDGKRTGSMLDILHFSLIRE